ncbi:MAG: SMC-Scp complex subunit ScpB [Steroidobacteraceae bacterium]
MSENHIRNVVEAALLAAGKSLSIADLAQLFDEDGRPEKPQIVAALQQLENEYADRGIELKETASGWRIQIKQGYGREVSRLWPERPQRYSRALLETLALVAYRQPITRAEIESVRGVAVNPNIIKTLMERDWVRVVGHRDVPGHPELLGTTREFLDYFSLRSIEDLPPLAELKAMVDLNPQLTLPVAGDAELPVDGDDVERAPGDAVGDAVGDQDASLAAPVADVASASAPVVEPAPSDDEPVYVVDRTEA